MFKAIFFNPLHNTLVFLSSQMPGADLGLAIIALTIIVKLILLPFYHQSLVTQIKLKKIDPLIKKIKAESGGDKTKETLKLLEIYKEHKIRPLMGILVMIVQLPIIIALFYVFKDSVSLQGANHIFLNTIDVTSRSIIAALLTGFTQFIQIKLSLPALPEIDNSKERSMKDDFTRSMHFQMKYFMPVVITVVAAGLPAALSLYWITSNVFGIAYELLVRRRLLKTA